MRPVTSTTEILTRASAGGAPPVDYALTPALPAGLTIDQATRTLSGTPTVVTLAMPYAYKAADANGSTDSLSFGIEVFPPASAEHDFLPEAFALHGNYPNPFRHTARLMMDLPWPARVTIEVMDVMGRHVLTAPSGLYLYRVHASSPGGRAVHAGRFVHVR